MEKAYLAHEPKERLGAQCAVINSLDLVIKKIRAYYIYSTSKKDAIF